MTREARIRRAALFLLLALGLEALSLVWRHPLAPLLFVGGGGFLALLGILSFLGALLAPSERRADFGSFDSEDEERRAS